MAADMFQCLAEGKLKLVNKSVFELNRIAVEDRSPVPDVEL
jgi:hypothetical protein